MKKIIHTEKAPAAIGTYNQAILTGNLLLTSGQIAINPLTGKLMYIAYLSFLYPLCIFVKKFTGCFSNSLCQNW